MRNLYILVFCILANYGFAQPGYMGKKLSLTYQFEFVPVFCPATRVLEYYEMPTNDNQIPNEKVFTYVTGQHYSLGWSITRKSEIYVEYSVRNMKYSLQAIGMPKYSAFSSDFDRYLFIPSKYTIDAVETFWDIGLRHYVRSFIAPVGFYTQISLGNVRSKYANPSNDILGTMKYVSDFGSNPSYIQSVATNNPSLNVYRIGFGVGLKKPIFNSVFLQYESNLHLILKSLPYGRIDDWDIRNGMINQENYGQGILNINFMSYFLIDFRVGIGIFI